MIILENRVQKKLEFQEWYKVSLHIYNFYYNSTIIRIIAVL